MDRQEERRKDHAGRQRQDDALQTPESRPQGEKTRNHADRGMETGETVPGIIQRAHVQESLAEFAADEELPVGKRHPHLLDLEQAEEDQTGREAKVHRQKEPHQVRVMVAEIKDEERG